MKLKGAIFDMDGTLVDSLMFWSHFWNRFGQEYMGVDNFQPDATVDKTIRTMVFADAAEYIKSFYNLSCTTEEFFQYATSGLADFYKQVAVAKPGASTLLEHLKGQNIKLCLASATEMKYVKLALDCCGLTNYFDLVLSCADIGVGKDQPDIYLSALRSMGLSKEDVCVFEDSYVALETAKKIGLHTVGIFDKYNFEQERLKKASDIYLEQDQTLDSLIAFLS